jgi:hypothetical protein
MTTDIAIPDLKDSRLPLNYEAAQRALAECSRLDECQEWASKAEAIASYARQAKDDTLRKYADRIQARAVRRLGELLKQIPPGHGANQNIQEGALPKVTRESAATEAGLSEHQRKTALRVAAVPEKEFEAQVNSDNPPSVTELAQQGTATKEITMADSIRASEAKRMLTKFSEFCQMNDPSQIGHVFKPNEIIPLRQCVGIVDKWLDQLFAALPETKP